MGMEDYACGGFTGYMWNLKSKIYRVYVKHTIISRNVYYSWFHASSLVIDPLYSFTGLHHQWAKDRGGNTYNPMYWIQLIDTRATI